MKAQWQTLASRFAALKRREQYLVAGALLALIVLGGYSFWVEPAQLRKAALARQIAQDQSDMGVLQGQVAGLQARIRDPEAADRTALAGIRQQLAAIDQQLAGFDQQLVAPDQMSNVLQALLSRHGGLELVSLKTLEPVPVIEPAAGKPSDSGKDAPPDSGNIYKHGIEIKLAGGYLDLLNYVDEMEKSPQRLLLGGMSLAVDKYPRVELSLTVYSLSLDRTWLIIGSR